MTKRGVAGAAILIGLSAMAGCAKHDAESAPPAAWTVAQGSGTDGQHIELSTDAAGSDAVKAKGLQPTTLRIVCRGGRPNVELSSLAAKCYGYCGQNPTVEVHELFMNSAEPRAQMASASAKSIATSPTYEQDLLSNAPGDIVIAGDTGPGVSQDGKWTEPSSSDHHGVLRFDYGVEPSDPRYIEQIDRQARNYIARIAASRWFRIGDDTQFDARGLSAKLPQFWAACPAPHQK